MLCAKFCIKIGAEIVSKICFMQLCIFGLNEKELWLLRSNTVSKITVNSFFGLCLFTKFLSCVGTS